MGRGPVVFGKQQIAANARGKVYAIHSKLIAMAAMKGADIHLNISLANAISDAKKASVPSDIIDRAVRRGSGVDKDSSTVEEIVYEGYTAGGAGILVRTLTDNKNRTASAIRHIFSAYGGSMGESGSVSGFMFGYGGEIYISRSGVDIQKLEEYILELPILDYILGENDDDICIYTERSEYAHVLSEISKNGYIVNKSGVAYTAKTHTEIIDFDKALKIYTMLEALDADEDVENVWNNADIADALWAEVAKKVEASKFRT